MSDAVFTSATGALYSVLIPQMTGQLTILIVGTAN
jgi:hypothetical protein